MLLLDFDELGVVDDGSSGAAREPFQESHLAEELAGAEHRERHLAIGNSLGDVHLSGADHEHPVAGIAFSKQDRPRLVAAHEVEKTLQRLAHRKRSRR